MLQGKKTYIAAIGLFVLGVSQIASGNVEAGIQSIVGALGLFGLRNAIPPTEPQQ